MSEQVERLKAFEYAAKPPLDDGETLRDEDVDLETGVVRVERSWDPKQGPIEPKSRAGRRVVPIVASLRSHLAARTLRRGGAEGLFFGEGDRPFDDGAAHDRARKA
jgi:integrase